MGNSSGGLKEYWDVFYAGTNARGAFVWDWVDQGIRQPVPAASRRDRDARSTFFAYGGYWEDPTGVRHDGNFCQNGLVSADRVPHPGLRAIKYVYRYLHAVPADLAAGTITVQSWFDEINPKDLVEGRWDVLANGRVIASGPISAIDLAPREKKTVALGLPALVAEPGVEYFLNVSFALKRETAWAPRGHEIAWEQWPLPLPARPEAPPAASDVPAPSNPLWIAEDGTFARLTGREFALVFDKLNGVLTSYAYRGVKLLDRGPLPDFWRAPTDNDAGAWKALGTAARTDPALDILVWKSAGPGWKVTDVQVRRVDDTAATIAVSAALPRIGASYTMTYDIRGTGEVVVNASYRPGPGPVAMMPRFGLELVATPGLEQVAWYGRGPAETYSDRAFERVGVYASTVRREWVEYSRPQENGNKADVRWVELTNSQGFGLRAEGLPLLSVSARHVKSSDIEQAAYSFDLPVRPEIYLNLDMAQTGVGGIDSWTKLAYPMDAYRIAGNQPHAYSVRLVPVARGPAPPATPPREWTDPATGYRVVRLSEEAGSASLYFHQNAYTAAGDKMVIAVPDGLATVNLKTREVEPVVSGRVTNVVVGPKSRQVFYLKEDAVYATHLDTRATRMIVRNPLLRSGSGLAVNATETLLAGSLVEEGAPPAPSGGGLEARWAARLPMALYTIEIASGVLRPVYRSTDWLNHVQFSPTDPTLLMFCHEGPWHKLDRIWTIRTDGTGLTKRHARQMEMEIAGHEFFSADGRTILVRPADAEERGVLARRRRTRHRPADPVRRGPRRLVGALQRFTGWEAVRGRRRRAAQRGGARQRPVDLPLHAGTTRAGRHAARRSHRSRLQPRAQRHVHAGRPLGGFSIEHARKLARVRGRPVIAAAVLTSSTSFINVVSHADFRCVQTRLLEGGGRRRPGVPRAGIRPRTGWRSVAPNRADIGRERRCLGRDGCHPRPDRAAAIPRS